VRILVADSDRRFLELMRGVVEGEGHRVAVADSAERARDSLHRALPDVLLSSLDFHAGGGFDVVRELRGLPGGDGVRVVCTTSHRNTDAPDIRNLVRECLLDGVLRKPFPMFDLVDMLRDLQIDEEDADADADLDDPLVSSLATIGRPSEPAGPLQGRLSDVRPSSLASYAAVPLQMDNVRRIAALWARRASGLLRLDHGPGGASGWMLMGEGGPLDSDGWELISAALHGGDVMFERRSLDLSAGDQLGLGVMLFGRVRDPSRDRYVPEHRFHLIRRPRYTDALDALPLSADTRRLLAAVDTEGVLGELLEELGFSGDRVGPDLYALVQLGLVELDLEGERTQQVARALPRRGGRVSGGRPGSASTPVSHPADSVSNSSARSDLRQRILARRRQANGGRLPAGAVGVPSDPPDSTPTDIAVGGAPPADSHAPDSLGVHAVRLRRKMAVHGRTPVARRVAQASARERRRRVAHLRRELKLLQGQPPAVVLGLPADAPAGMVEQAGQRMIARYDEMTRDPLLPGEGHALAQQILELVRSAHTRMLAGGSAAAPPPPRSDADRFLDMARGLMQREEWAQALVMLRRARDEDLGDPAILACLGWATLHDPALSEGKRNEEASGLLLLAVQFGPDDFDANYYLARYLAARDNLDAACARAARALRSRPDDPAAQALLNKLRRQRDAQAPAD